VTRRSPNVQSPVRPAPSRLSAAQEALVVYLQHLPPVDSAVPAHVPPAPGDPEADTFWFAYSGVYRR